MKSKLRLLSTILLIMSLRQAVVAQFDSLTRYRHGDEIIKYSSVPCSLDSFIRDGKYLYNCEDGYEVKQWVAGANEDSRIKIAVSKDNQQVWYTSNYGVFHFDRSKDEWRQFRESTGELVTDVTRNIALDSNGNTWITYRYHKGLTRINGDNIYHYNNLNSNLGSDKVAAIGTNSLGDFYVNSSAGLMTYDPVGDSFVFRANLYGTLMTFRGDTVYLAFGMSSSIECAWYSPSAGQYKNRTSVSWTNGELADMVVYPKRDTILVASVQHGIFCLTSNFNRFTTLNLGAGSNSIKIMKLLDDDSIWLNRTVGYTKFHKSDLGQLQHYYNPEFTGNDYYINDSNQVWILSNILKLWKDSIIPISSSAKEGVTYGFNAATKLPNGDLIATGGFNHYAFYDERWHYISQGFNTFPGSSHIVPMPNDEVWIISDYAYEGYEQIFVYDQNYMLKRAYTDTVTGLSETQIRDVVRTRDGRLFISSQQGLLMYSTDLDSFQLFTTDNSGLYLNDVYDLAVDLNDWVYISNGKLSRYDGQEIITISEEFNFSRLAVDKNNTLWALQRYGSSSFIKIQLSQFGRLDRDRYRYHGLDTFYNQRNIPQFGVDYDLNAQIMFETGLIKWNKDSIESFELIDDEFLPKITSLELGTTYSLYAGEEGIWDFDVDYEDTLGKYDPHSFYVEGRVYYDKNTFGVFDDNDVPLAYRKVMVLPDSIVVYTDLNGQFNYFLDSSRKGDEITFIHMTDSNYWTGTRNTQKIVLGELNQRIFYLDFPNRIEEYTPDIRLSLTVSSMDCGDSVILAVFAENKGTMPSEGELIVRLDSLCSGVDFENKNDTIDYKLGLNQSLKQSYKIYLPIDSFADSILKFRAEIAGTNVDHIVEDSLEVMMNCTGSDFVKTNTPFGFDTAHYISDSSRITYAISYQNVSTDTQVNVFLIDTLDRYLQYETFDFHTSSHPVKIVRANNLVVFAFDSINLPPGSSLSLENKVSVTFSVKTYENLDSGTQIQNRAAGIYSTLAGDTSIVFSNLVFNTIFHPGDTTQDSTNFVSDLNSDKGISIWPNPFEDHFSLSSITPIESYTIVDLQGHVYEVGQCFSATLVDVSSIDLVPGVYFIKVKLNTGVNLDYKLIKL